MHGNEPAPRYALRGLVEGATVVGLDLWVVPVYNPDGLAHHTRKNAHGVDPNRNYPYKWARLTGNYYSGRRPSSEPETRAVVLFVLENPNIGVANSMDTRVPMHLRPPSTSRSEERMYPEDLALYEHFDSVGLTKWRDNLAGEMSGGQQQRVAVARALAMNPPLLLADEPTGNLDTQMARGVMELLEEINAAGTTIVMVTHDPELAARAQRNVHIVDGQVTDLVREPVLATPPRHIVAVNE